MAGEERESAPEPLLATRLYVPAARGELVVPPRLTERMDRGATASLLLVSAPAGFGKSTLLAQWAQGKAQPVAWLSLDRDDNDPTTFWTYVIAARQTVAPEVGVTARTLLGQGVPVQAVLAALLNDLGGPAAERGRGAGLRRQPHGGGRRPGAGRGEPVRGGDAAAGRWWRRGDAPAPSPSSSCWAEHHGRRARGHAHLGVPRRSRGPVRGQRAPARVAHVPVPSGAAVVPLVGPIGAPLLLASDVATMFGAFGQFSGPAAVAAFPVALWELSVGLWMALRGFRPSPVTADLA